MLKYQDINIPFNIIKNSLTSTTLNDMLTMMVLFNCSANLRPWFKHPNLHVKQVYQFASLFTFLIYGFTSYKSAWQSFGITHKSCSTVAMTMVGKPRDLCPTQSLGKVLGSLMDFVLPPSTELSSNCAIVQSSNETQRSQTQRTQRRKCMLQTQTRFEPTPLR